MPLPWNIKQRKNPQHPEEPGKFYAQAQSGAAITDEQIDEEVAREMGMSIAVARSADDAYGVVRARHLQNGSSVPLRHIGRLGVSITSDGAATPEEVARLKKEISLTIRTDAELRNELEHGGFTYTGDVVRLPETP